MRVANVEGTVAKKVDKGVGLGVGTIGKEVNRNLGRVAKGKGDKLRRRQENVVE